MKRRKLGGLLLLAAVGGLGGCVAANDGMGGPVGFSPGSGGPGTYMSSYRAKGPMDGEAHCGAYQMPCVPNTMGPDGAPIPQSAPYATAMTAGESAARAAFVQQVPLDLIQQTDLIKTRKLGSEVLQAGYQRGPDGAPILPAAMQGLPGPVPPGGPGPFGAKPPAAVAAVGALTGGGGPFVVQRTSVRFVGPAGMRITWFAPTPDGKAGFGPNYLEAPARYNFAQACIYRLKLSDIPNRPGLELYPTLEVVPTNARTATFLAHSAVPISFTDEDFAQVAAGNYVVKVVYLPDPQYQDLASVGPDEVVSSRLEPGVDPIAEAHRRGSILLVVRMGNIDLEAPNTPAMDAPSPYQPRPPQHGLMPGAPGCPPGAGPGPMVPYGALNGMGQLPAPPGIMPPGSMPPGALPPPDMIPPGLRPKGSAPVNMLPPPGPMGQANDDGSVKQAKFSPAKKADAPKWSLWPFGKKDEEKQ
jgi:hypothetical protein